MSLDEAVNAAQQFLEQLEIDTAHINDRDHLDFWHINDTTATDN